MNIGIFDNAVPFHVSNSAILEIVNQNIDTSIEIIGFLTHSKLQLESNTVTLQWLPGHCDIEGNENADSLAKKGSNIT